MEKARNHFLSTKIMMMVACLFLSLLLCPKTVSAERILERSWGLSTDNGVFYGYKSGEESISKGDKITLTVKNSGRYDIYIRVYWEMSGIANGQFDIREAVLGQALPDVPDESITVDGKKEIDYKIPASTSIVIETYYSQKPFTTGGSNLAKIYLSSKKITASEYGTAGSGEGGSGTGTGEGGSGTGTGTGGTGTGGSGTGEGGSSTGTGEGGSGTGTGTGGTVVDGDVVTLDSDNTFTLEKSATVTVSTSVNCGESWDIWQKGGKNLTWDSDDNVKTLKLRPGSYKIDKKSSFPAGTTITVTKKDFNFGSVKVSLASNYRTFTAEYIPAKGTLEEDVATTYIESWRYSADYRNGDDFIGKKLRKISGVIDYPSSTPGWYTLTFHVMNKSFIGGGYLQDDIKVSIPQIPETPGYKASYMTNVTHNSATFANLPSPSCGAYSIVQVYENGAWKDKTAGKAWGSAVLTGLKPNTTYRCRLRGKEVCSPQNILSFPSNEFTFRTGVNVKPAIKSVKISKAKVSKVAAKPATGYWDSFGNWHRVAASPAYYLTSYKITVTLKKNVSSLKGPKGMVINGKYVKGTGKTFTVKESVKGKKIGKSIKVNVKYANDPSYGGYSPAVTKKAKIKK